MFLQTIKQSLQKAKTFSVLMVVAGKRTFFFKDVTYALDLAQADFLYYGVKSEQPAAKATPRIRQRN